MQIVEIVLDMCLKKLLSAIQKILINLSNTYHIKY